MLVLCRHSGEWIVIDDKIKLKVLSVKGKKVRIGFLMTDGTEGVSIRRGEKIVQDAGSGVCGGSGESPGPLAKNHIQTENHSEGNRRNG